MKIKIVELGGEFHMERKNIFLVIIIVVLIVLIGVVGYYFYQADRMHKVDKLMLDGNNNLGPKLLAKENEANMQQIHLHEIMLR